MHLCEDVRMSERVFINIVVPEALKAQALKAAAEDKRSLSSWGRILIETALENKQKKRAK